MVKGLCVSCPVSAFSPAQSECNRSQRYRSTSEKPRNCIDKHRFGLELPVCRIPVRHDTIYGLDSHRLPPLSLLIPPFYPSLNLPSTRFTPNIDRRNDLSPIHAERKTRQLVERTMLRIRNTVELVRGSTVAHRLKMSMRERLVRIALRDDRRD